MNIIKCAKFNVMLNEDYIIRIKNRFERCRNSWQYRFASMGIEFHNNFPPANLTFYEIFILKLAGEYSSKRWNIIYAAHLGLMNVWVLLPPEPANADVFPAVGSFSLEEYEYSPWARRRKPPPPLIRGILGTYVVLMYNLKVFQSSFSHLSSGSVWPKGPIF